MQVESFNTSLQEAVNNFSITADVTQRLALETTPQLLDLLEVKV